MSPPEPALNKLGQLEEAFLESVTFERNLAFDFASEAAARSYLVDTDTTVRLLDSREQAIVHLHATIEWFDAEEAAEEDDQPLAESDAPFALTVTIGGFFSWLAPELPDEDVRNWLEFNGEHLLWPYLRTYVATITTAAGIPPLTIYTIGVPRLDLGKQQARRSDELTPSDADPA